MSDLSKLIYRTSKGEIRVQDLTDDATALARFELTNDERTALAKQIQNGDWTPAVPKDGGWI